MQISRVKTPFLGNKLLVIHALISICCVFSLNFSYHHGEGEGYDVDGPQWAEAGQDGQDQVVPRFGPVHSGLSDCAGLAGERGPR